VSFSTQPASALRIPTGPPALPILGWRGSLLRFFADPIAYMSWLYAEHGVVAAFTATGNGNLIFVKPGLPRSPVTLFAFSPEANYRLLTEVDTFQSSALNGPDTPAFRIQSSNIFGMSGERHRQQRRLLLPAFHKQRVEAYHYQMVHFTEQMLAAWRPGEVRDVARDMQQLTLNIVTTALFGLDVSTRTTDLGRMLQRWLTLIVSPAGLLRWDAPFMPYGQLIRLTDAIVAAIQELIAEKRTAGATGDDMLSMLIQTADEDGARLADEELIGHSSGLFIAGHETSANALSWTLLLLAQHPAILADLVDELTGLLGGAAPSIEQLGRLPLLDAVLKESLRLFPPASMLGRVAVAATELDGHAVPAGSEVIYSPYITHRIPELFDRPQLFRPERWATLKPSPYAYLPFSAGPRMCLGTAFASMELKVILALLLQRYRLELPAGLRVDRQLVITLAPAPGLPMHIYPQDRRFPANPSAITGKIHTMVVMPNAA
jgi:cytochrome P450